MKKILFSMASIGVVAVIAIASTGAFFSDEETSFDNTFEAGAIDLLIDNTSYGFDWNDPEVIDPQGVWGLNANNSWEAGDLDGELFFSFADLKPGDYGEDTISMRVHDNDAWACMAFDLTGTPENNQPEPEAIVDQTTGENEGELQNYLSFLFWYDDGDNVLEEGEQLIESLNGLSGEIFDGNWLAIADGDDEPLIGGKDYYIGKGWCFGDITASPVASDDYGSPSAGNTGFICSGEGDHNDAQTDGIVVNVSFYAEQARHNEGFRCEGVTPVPRHISLENKEAGTWSIISDDLTYGDIHYSHNDTSFNGVVTGTGLDSNSPYQITLNGPGGCTFTDVSLGDFTTNLFHSGFWDSAAPNLNTTCVGDDEGLFNMDLIGDHYTFMSDGSGAFTHNFDFALPAGDYSGVKVLVKKMLPTHVSPWADTGAGYPAFNLYETQAISFTVLP